MTDFKKRYITNHKPRKMKMLELSLKADYHT